MDFRIGNENAFDDSRVMWLSSQGVAPLNTRFNHPGYQAIRSFEVMAGVWWDDFKLRA